MKKEELINVFMEFVGEKFPELIDEEKNFSKMGTPTIVFFLTAVLVKIVGTIVKLTENAYPSATPLKQRKKQSLQLKS